MYNLGPNSSRLFACFVFVVLSLFVGVPSLSAHGGGLDSDGGHNCRVGSCAGTYHCHQARGPRCGGGSSSNASKNASPQSFCVNLTRSSLSDGDVRLIEVALLFKGFNPGPIDGVIGHVTSRAINSYENSRGLMKSPSERIRVGTIIDLGVACKS
jgi:hypothetical protein